MVLVAGAWLPGWTPGPDDDSAKWFQSGALFAALYIVALGTGGIKPNVSAFGADQLDVTDPQVHSQALVASKLSTILCQNLQRSNDG